MSLHKLPMYTNDTYLPPVRYRKTQSGQCASMTPGRHTMYVPMTIRIRSRLEEAIRWRMLPLLKASVYMFTRSLLILHPPVDRNVAVAAQELTA